MAKRKHTSQRSRIYDSGERAGFARRSNMPPPSSRGPSAVTLIVAGVGVVAVVLVLAFAAGWIGKPGATPSPSPAPTASPSPSPTASPSPSPTPTPPPEPWTADLLRGVYFTNTRSVADYYDEVSAGQISISGDVYGWFTVPADTSGCNHQQWGDAARAAATAAGIDLTAYTNVAVVFPKQAACWWVGMAQLPGRNTYVNGSAGWTYATWLFTGSHELGHNFGMNHASTISCTSGGVRVAFSNSCTTDEYGDPFDTMGGNGQRHFNTWHRWQLGVLGAADVQTVTESGVYRVATAEISGGVPRVLRVTRPSGNYYYLEYRQPYGRYDNFASTAAVVNGVAIRIAPGVGSMSFSKLIDTVPQTNSFYDAPLRVGRCFADSVNDIFVVTQAIDPTGATVLVHIGPDTILPTAPDAAQATSDATGTVTLRWQPATDDVFVAGYQVSRDGTIVGTTDGTSLTESGLPQATTYDYSVSAVDEVGNVGPPASATFFLPDTTPPGSVGSLSAASTGPHSVALGWVAAPDNVAVSSYAVLRNGTLIGTTAGTSLEDAAAPDGISLTYQVRAVDEVGNQGPLASAAISLPDVTGPALGGGLTLSVTPSGDVDVTWPSATDNVGTAGYDLSRDGAPIATTTGTQYLDPGLAQAHTYQYSVVASDAAGNPSQALTGTIYLPDLLAPVAPGSLNVVQSAARAVDLGWSAATDNVAVDHYLVAVDDLAVATTTLTQLLALAVDDGVDHTFTVAAVDGAGNVGPAVSAHLSLPDVTAPSLAGSFSARATGPTSIALSWTAATDNVGVAGYRLLRDGAPLAELGGSARGYTDAGLASDASHTYTLMAVDGAGNLGPESVVQVKLTSVDVTAPSAPLGLSAVALSRRRISLTWQPSIDNQAGALSYRVFRGRIRIATVTTARYLDRPAVSGWYKYRVKAVDASGNVSSFSVAVWIKAHA